MIGSPATQDHTLPDTPILLSFRRSSLWGTLSKCLHKIQEDQIPLGGISRTTHDLVVEEEELLDGIMIFEEAELDDWMIDFVCGYYTLVFV